MPATTPITGWEPGGTRRNRTPRRITGVVITTALLLNLRHALAATTPRALLIVLDARGLMVGSGVVHGEATVLGLASRRGAEGV